MKKAIQSAGAVAPDAALQGWLDRLTALIDDVDKWAVQLDWSTRRITKKMQDSTLGTYQAPALILQKETARILLEPIAPSAPGADGVVDLYLMPAYDDIASLYLVEGNWQLHYMFAGTPSIPTIREAESKPLSKVTLKGVLDEMTRDAA